LYAVALLREASRFSFLAVQCRDQGGIPANVLDDQRFVRFV
jgi:hypothetical protein